MKSVILTAVVIASTLTLSACGETKGDRAISGGAIGAGAGAVAGAILGSTVQGAVIGGAVGAATGAITDSDQIDLGTPVWK